MIRSLLAVLLVGSLAVAAVPRASAAPTTVPAAVNDSGGRPANDRRVVATSVDGMPIVARHYGALDAPVQLVVVGQMHGSEPGGQAVVRELAKREPPSGVGLWLIITMNPDGDRRDTRANARGVDLNRNFPSGWQASARHGTYWSGPHAASEPETRGMVRFLTDVHPTALISYHQAFDVVDISHPRSAAAGRQLARWMGKTARAVPCAGPCHGTMTQWVDAALKAVALTVELDARVSPSEARRAATAVLRLGTWLGR